MKYLISISFLVLCMSSCNNVETGSESLADRDFQTKIFGRYKWTSLGANKLNQSNYIFSTVPNPPYTVGMVFDVQNTGDISSYTEGSNAFCLLFLNALQEDTSSAVYSLVRPAKDQSGEATKTKRFLKINLDNATNIYFSEFYSTTNEAHRSVATNQFAQQSY